LSRIRILPDNLVNQIAAGEVVERPASVVKELLDNALDAGASRIDILVEGGGRRRIRVADDGAGLDRDDALLALERHATSKLSEPGDLARIVTLGFRGEALPAIASVSRMTLLTSTGTDAATCVEVEGGRVVRVTASGHPKGTTVDVRDLFFNTPARAKFLRTPATELGHISALAGACAVANERVAISLTSEGRHLLAAAPAGDRLSRIVQVFGPEWGEAIPFDGRRGPLTAHGFIAPPSEAASTRRMQHLYVNGRLVKDRLLGHAIGAACDGFFPKGRHAALFLFVECPPDAVDVNVHPAKAEVRFGASRQVHDLVVESILAALRRALPITALQAAAGVETTDRPPPETGTAVGVHEAAMRYLARPAPAGPASFPRASAGTSGEAVTDGVSSILMDRSNAVPLAHYRESYIVAADDQGLLLVDQHAAHERILFEQLMCRRGTPESGDRQVLLFPLTVAVPRALVPRIDEAARQLEELGFGAEPFGEETIVVREAPALLGAIDMGPVVADLLDQMEAEDGGTPVPDEQRQRRRIATIACHAAIKVRMPLTPEKMNYLIKELFRTQSPLKCPHGRPAILRFSHDSIERGFDRR